MGERRGTLPVHAGMVSVTVLRRKAGGVEVLLARRAEAYLQGVWSYIAGHVRVGETGGAAALRELREETGLVPAALYATSFCETFYAPASGAVEIVPAFVARVAMDARVCLNAEHSECAWLSLEEASDRVPFGSQRELLAHVRREFVEREPSAHLLLHPETH